MNVKLIVLSLILLLLHACVNDTAENKSDTQTKKIITNDVTTKLPELPANLKVRTPMPPKWTYNATIYEVNIRQYTPKGSFKAFETHLPRLKEMGVGILWLMPIHPIGNKKRKGSMGSYYAVKDYKKVAPEFGSIEDLKSLVNKAHSMGMYVIIDWIANHSAWDNLLIEEHPDWYTLNNKGEHISPVPDWSDVADFNYDNKNLQAYMIDAMKFWVNTTNIDGFRCDMAGMVPVAFWNKARKELDKIKPVFMLAEAEEPELHYSAFDMTYALELHHLMNGVAKDEKNALDINGYFNREELRHFTADYRMQFITNHDENALSSTTKERMGDAEDMFTVFTFVVPGMPLVYSGQEADLNKKLKFFDKDQIDWKNYPKQPFYTQLIKLKKDHRVLWNGAYGGDMKRISTTNERNVFAFSRSNQQDSLIMVFNLSDRKEKFLLNDNSYKGSYQNLMDNEMVKLSNKKHVFLKPWQYYVLKGIEN